MSHLGNALSAISSLVPTWLAGKHGPLATVPRLDLHRYAGRWYEIATLPIFAQRGCSETTATYRMLSSGALEVVNRCRDAHGVRKEIVGRAWIADPAEPGKLKVSFYWPLRADYWVIALGDDYDYAMVGHPSRHALWILSRTPQMAPELYQRLLRQARAQGYDLSRLSRTEHAPTAS